MTVRRPLVALMALAAALALMVPFLSGRAGAADSSVYLVHGIPATPVDVYVNGQLAVPGFAPLTSVGPLTLPAGDYTAQVFAAVGSPPQAAADRVDAAVITSPLTVPSGANVSVVANLRGGTANLAPFVNDLTGVAEGSGRVTVRHTANAPAVDIKVNGTVAIPNLQPGAEASAVLPAGTYDFQVVLAGTDTVVLDLPGTAIAAAKNSIVYAVGDATATPSTLTAVLQAIDLAAPTAPAPAPAPPAAAGVTTNPAVTG